MHLLSRWFLSMVLLMAIPMPAAADMFTPSHMCQKPQKPYQFTSQWEVDSFSDAVDRYKRCITDFVEEQTTAANNHSEAIDDAIDEWNRFVRNELN